MSNNDFATSPLLDGVWAVQFVRSVKAGGGFENAGIFILEANRILGGSHNYTYAGTFDIEDGLVKAEVHVTQYAKAMPTIFPPLEEFTLVIRGVQLSERTLHFFGSVSDDNQYSIRLQCTRHALLPEGSDYVVHPTGPVMKGKPYYTDDAMTALFSAHVGNICSEREVIWQRYNIMVVANTFLLGAIGTGNVRWINVEYMVFFGWFLCAIWLGMTATTWGLLQTWQEIAAKFSWPSINYLSDKSKSHDVNPFIARRIRRELYSKDWRRKWYYIPICEWIGLESMTYFYACALIILFAAGYGLLWYLYPPKTI